MLRALLLVVWICVLFVSCSTVALPPIQGQWQIQVVLPGNHTTQISTNTNLAWETVPLLTNRAPQPRAFDYTIFLHDHLPLETIAQQGYNATSWQPDTPLLPATKYYWKIQLYDAGQLLATSAVWDFTTVANTVDPAVTVSSIEQLQNAIDNARVGGPKRIIIAKGTYMVGNTIILDVDGVTVEGAGSRTETVLQGQSMSDGTNHIFLVRGDYVSIKNLTLQRVINHAIQVQGDLGNIGFLLKNCILRDTGEQMLKVSYDPEHLENIAQDGSVEDCLFEYTAAFGPQWYIGGVDAHNARNWVVRDCTFRNIRSPEYEPAEFAIHFWSDSRDTLVERNTIINCDRGIGFGLGDRGHLRGIIRNNMIFHDNLEGFADVGIAAESAPDVQIYNNTIFLLSDYPNAIEIRFPVTANAQIINNLTNRLIRTRDGATGVFTDNLSNALLDWFVQPLTGNLHLQYNLPTVIDQGTTLEEVTDDFDKQDRPIGGGYEIGADEVAGSSLPDYPENPVNDAQEIFNRYPISGNSFWPNQVKEFERTITGHQGESVTLRFRLSLYGTIRTGMPLLVQVHEWGGDFERQDEIVSYESSLYEFIHLSFEFVPSSVNETCWWVGTRWNNTLYLWAEKAILSILDEVLDTSIVSNAFGSGSIDRNRVYLFGHSIGGTGAFQIGIRNPQYFAAIHAHSGFSTFTPPSGDFQELFESMIVGTQAENTKVEGTAYSARSYTNLSEYLQTIAGAVNNLPFISMTSGTDDTSIPIQSGGDWIRGTFDDQRYGFFFHRHSGGHSEDCFVSLNWMWNFRKNQSYLAFTNRSGYGIGVNQTVNPGDWSSYVAGGINDLYEMGWNPSTLEETVDYYKVQLTGSGIAHVTIRNAQLFLLLPNEEVHYWVGVKTGVGKTATCDANGILTIPAVTAGQWLTVERF